MDENSNIVQETRVLQVTSVAGPQNRIYHRIDIPYQGFSFRPGQFVMIKIDGGPTCWAYPYMIQSGNEKGFTVYAGERTSLFQAEQDTPLVVWGPSGRPVFRGEHTVILVEPPAAFLASPFLHDNSSVPYIAWMPETEGGFLNEYKKGIWVDTLSEMAEELKAISHDTVIAALNVSTVNQLANYLPEEERRKLMVFASTRISCGVDGCKSCYLHSDTIQLGISVCCNGPYLPYGEIDFEANKRCFYELR